MASQDVLARDYVTALNREGINRYDDLHHDTRDSLFHRLNQANWGSGVFSSQDNRKVVEFLFQQKERGFLDNIMPEHVVAALAGRDDTDPW